MSLLSRLIVLTAALTNNVSSATANCLQGEANRALEVYDVYDGSSLKSYLGSRAGGGGGAKVARLNVINGTHWINLGGGIQDFGLVLGKPPSSSSDTTLKQAVEALNATTSQNHNILIDYEQPNLMELILQNIANYGAIANAKLWVIQQLEAEVETLKISQPGGVDAREDVNVALRMPDVGFGLDKVFDRVLKENYLLPFDYARIKKILSDVFSLESVESNEVLYLKRKAKVVAQRHRNSFTELYLSNIVHLLADDNSRALRKYRQDPLANPLIFMPDLQQTDAVYTRTEVDQVEEVLTQLEQGGSCVILETRGGVFSQNESLRNIKALMDRHPGVRLLVRVDPYDSGAVDAEKLVTAIKIIGAGRVLAQVPPFIRDKMADIDGSLMVTTTPTAAAGAGPVLPSSDNGVASTKDVPLFLLVSSLLIAAAISSFTTTLR